MLNRLFVKNIALIDSLEIEFSDGFNVISGETGAGKSVIVDSVNLALGERADRELIRRGQTSAFVEAVFDTEEQIIPIMENYGLPADEMLIITREFSSEGKNVCRINGRTVTLSVLREITSALVDMHGQHEHQALLNSANHLSVLDSFAADELDALKVRVADLYGKYRCLKAQSEKLLVDDSIREQRIDILEYQINEIENAALTLGEEEELRDRRRIIQNGEKIARALNSTCEALDGNNRASDSLNTAVRELGRAAEYDPGLNALFERIQSAYYEVCDITSEMRSAADSAYFDENELDEIEDRLELINKLNRKYGGSISAVLEFFEQASEELERLKNSEELLGKLKKDTEACRMELLDASLALSQARRKAAKVFEVKLLEQVRELGMPGADFVVEFQPETQDEVRFGADGIDSPVFMFSANKGEPVKALTKIISGGELSRFMLAVKTIMARHFGVSTMIFDEIDTGISGKMAHAVAHKLCAISRDRQVICVTHLPQIASMGDAHYLIQKTESADKTTTTLTRLDEQGVVAEIARLSGGSDLEHSSEHSRAMLGEARRFKAGLSV